MDDPTYLDFLFAAPIYGMQGPAHAHALISVPTHTLTNKPLPVIVLLEGRAHLYEHESSGRQLFDNGINDFILITPKADGDDSVVLSRTNSQEDWRFAEDALWRLVTESLFEINRRLDVGTVDFSRIYCTGYSLGGDSCFGLAALPGVGRLLAGLVPFACRGDESLIYTSAGLDEFRGLRVWGLQNATERDDWKMHWMVKNLHKLVDGERDDSEEKDLCRREEVFFEAPWLEGEGRVQKYIFGKKEVWEIVDSKSSTWTQRGLRYKHHNCWTDIMKSGVLGRYITSWMLEGTNLHVDVAGELSYSLILRRPLCGCVRGRSAPCAEPVPWEHAESKICKAKRLGVWASPEGVVGANIPWKDGCAPAHGKSVLVGDEIVAWEEKGGVVHLQLHRGQHLQWKPTTDKRLTFEGATCTPAREADFHKWFPKFEYANQICFRSRCLGNFDIATQWNDAKFVDFSKRKGSIEAESTAAETEEDCLVTPIDSRLRAQADREKRVFLSSRFCLSMLCHSALDLLLAEYECKLSEGVEFYTKTEVLREAAKNKLVYEEFHEQPWRWVNRIRRVLRDARQPWLQISVLNDRLGLDKAGVPVTKKRIAKCEESDLFCFMEDTMGEGKKAQKELFVGLNSEVEKRYPEKYKLWVRPEKSQSGGTRFCKICAESEKRKSLASTHDVRFCKFAPKLEQ